MLQSRPTGRPPLPTMFRGSSGVPPAAKKRRTSHKQTKIYNKDIICLPHVPGDDVVIPNPRGEKRSQLAAMGLIGKIAIHSVQIWIIYVATFGMIFLDFVFEDLNYQKLNFVEKNDLPPYNIFLWKEGRSFQTWEDGNNWPASKTRFCWMILLKTATNSSNNGYFPLNITWHVTWLGRSTNSTLKCSGR